MRSVLCGPKFLARENEVPTVRELMSLEGRVSVVTGGATGIGLHMATALAEAGSNLVICSRKLENCEQAAAAIEKLGVKALAVGCDVTKPDQVDAMKDATLKAFGRVDVLGVLVQPGRQAHRERVLQDPVDPTLLELGPDPVAGLHAGGDPQRSLVGCAERLAHPRTL